MKNYMKFWLLMLLAPILISCGGGGGSAGTVNGSVNGSSTSGTTPPIAAAVPTLALVLTSSSGAVLTSNSISSGGVFFAKATVLDADGNGLPNILVAFSTDATIGTLASSAALTDDAGVAKVQLSPASLTGSNAAVLSARASVGTKQLTAELAYQPSAANVVIGAVTANPSAISALQSSTISANVTINGIAATAGQVTIAFAASCGTFSPATAATSSSGIATSTYKSTATCSGNVTITALASSTTASGVIAVAAATAANILYDSATVISLVVSSASSGAKQSTVKFKVVDAGGAGMAGQDVLFSLDQQSRGAGITFNVNGTLDPRDQRVPTDATGIASAIIQSGSLPTPVVVRGTLSPSMFATSSGIVVTSGKPTQNNASLATTKLIIEGLNKDGVLTTLTLRMADRQANPVPVGTAVTFVASHGTVQGSCLTDASSACSVTYTSSGVRPLDGLVTILAYLDGEESFTDLNGNNLWDAGEPFEDMGMAYRDDNRNFTYDGTEQTYPGEQVQVGSSACPSPDLSVTNTCDGTWSSSIRVRKSIVIGLASGSPRMTLVGVPSIAGFDFMLGDSENSGVGMPDGTTITAEVGAFLTSGCTVKSVGPAVSTITSPFPRTYPPSPIRYAVSLNANGGCSRARIDITTTSPAGVKVSVPFVTIP